MTIFLVDMDAFFVSVEELYDPSLKGKPVVVGGELEWREGRWVAPRGVAAAASYAARRYGIHSAMPLAQALRLCPQAVFLPGHHDRYREYSEKIQEIFGSFTPRFEMVSVDEGYLDMTGTERLWGQPLKAAALLHERVRCQTGLPCSIGAAGSRLVAKVACELAKPNGVLAVVPGQEARLLAPLPVRRIPGIGKTTEKRLRQLGVKTVADLAAIGGDMLEEVFGASGAAMFRKTAGEDAGGWYDTPVGEAEDAKSISHETTFDIDTADGEKLQATLSELSQMVAHRLREQSFFARTVTLKLRYSDFRTITRAQTLPAPTDLDGDLFRTAMALFTANWNGSAVRLVGVRASGLERRPGQMDLLDGERRQKWHKALEAADRVRGRFGFDAVQLAGGMAGSRKPKSTTGEE
jgi:DNA polymerase-4